jgi:hypothetical protein
VEEGRSQGERSCGEDSSSRKGNSLFSPPFVAAVPVGELFPERPGLFLGKGSRSCFGRYSHPSRFSVVLALSRRETRLSSRTAASTDVSSFERILLSSDSPCCKHSSLPSQLLKGRNTASCPADFTNCAAPAPTGAWAFEATLRITH